MNNLPLDPRSVKTQAVAKYVGVGVVAVAASVAVIVAGASVAIAGVAAIAGLVMVNFAVPVAARQVDMWRQKSLTAIAENFSEETIREDEVKESERIKMLEKDYITSRSQLEGAQEELRQQMDAAKEEEKAMLTSQVAAMQNVIDVAEETLVTRKNDFAELQRVNKLYIALHRSAAALQKAQGAERNSEELQRIETARNAIKTKMRAAMAGQTIAAMNAVKKKPASLNLLPEKGGKS